jgi:hypothetical protein
LKSASSRKRSYLGKLAVVLRAKPAASLAAGLLALTAVAGCGGSGNASDTKTSASAYVTQVCTSVGTWLRSLEISSAQIGKQLTPGTTPTRAKQALEGLMASSVADSEHVVSGLRSAGTPEVPQGGAIATAVVSSFQQATTVLQGLQTQVKGLPTENPHAFLAAAQQIGSTVKGSLSSIGGGLASLHSPELQHAANKSSACKNLGTSGNAA